MQSERYRHGGFFSATVDVSGDEFRFRRGFDRVHLPWKGIARFELRTFHREQNSGQLSWGGSFQGVRLVAIKTADERGRGLTVGLDGLEWPDSRYSDAIDVRDWLNGYVERHGDRER